MIDSVIWAWVQLEGWHHWPTATPHRAYLAASHRHLFGVTVTVPATVDNDRTVEFHDLQQLIRGCWPQDRDWHDASCEVIAQRLGAYLIGALLVPWLQVEVDEDGECGARVTMEQPL